MTWADAFALFSVMGAFVAIAYIGVKANRDWKDDE